MRIVTIDPGDILKGQHDKLVYKVGFEKVEVRGSAPQMFRLLLTWHWQHVIVGHRDP